MNDFKVIVNRKPGYDLYEIYLIERSNGKSFNGTIKKGLIEFKEVKEGATKEPNSLLKIQGRYWDSFVRAVSEDLPNVTREEIDAELKATKYHLEDMRKIAKVKP